MPEDSNQEIDKVTEEAFKKRDKFWQSIGEVEPRVYAPLINPTLTGGPEWPNLRQAYRKIKLSNGNMVLATDGLSDPFSPNHPMKKDVNGFEIELYVETDEDLANPAQSWQMDALNQVAQTAAHRGDLRELVEELKYLSIELSGVRVPVGYHYPEGQGGVLLGLPSKTIAPKITLPSGDILLVSITVLYPKELEMAAQGEENRNKLAELFTQKFDEPLSSVIREPLT